MKIKTFVTGALYTCSYLLEDKQEAILIDCGGNPKPILTYLGENNLKLKHILITHGHGDHIHGLNQIRETTKADIGIHKKDVIALTHAFNLSLTNAEAVKEDFHFKEGDIIKLNDLEIKIIDTPGHTPGGVCLYLEKEKVLFTGDTLFKHGIGRDDFPGGNWEHLQSSLTKILSLDPKIKIYPGHGDSSTIGAEKKFLSKHMN
jgi:hydroxyacylglutathione hydrolase